MKNLKKLLFTIAFLGVLITPIFVSAATSEELQAKIAALSKQIAELQTQLAQIQNHSKSASSDTSKININFSKIRQLTEELESTNKTVSGRHSAPELDALSKIVKERASLVKILMKEDPRLFLSIAMPKTRRSSFPANIQKNIEEETTITAKIEVLDIDDFNNPKNSRLEYSLKVGSEKLNFYPAKNLYIVSGTKVQVKGFRLENTVVVNINKNNFQVLRETPLLDSTGDQKTLVFLVEFLDSGPRPFTKEEAYNLIFNGQFQNFMKEQSYNQVSFSGDVSDWITLQKKPESGSVCGRTYFDNQEIQNFINTKGINLGNYDRLVYLINHPSLDGGCSQVGKLDYQTFNGNNYYFSQSWISLSNFNVQRGDSLPFSWTVLDFLLAHELGHALGVLHANGWDCGDQTLYGNACQHIEYGNHFDTMGNGFYSLHFNAFFKELLRWLPANKSLFINQSGTYTINPLELNSGSNFAKVQIFNSTTTPFYLEYRRGIGFDANLNDSHLLSNQSGLFINSYLKNQQDIYSYLRLLDISPTSLEWWKDIKETTLNAPNIFNDPGRGITIGPIRDITSSSITFDVKIETPTCVRQAPLIGKSYGIYRDDKGGGPYPYQVNAGGSGYIGILIVNNDYFGCGQSDFDVIPIIPSSWQYEVYPSENISIFPGEDGWKSVDFSVPQDAAPGEYLLKYEVINRTGGQKTTLEGPILVIPSLNISDITPLSGRVGAEITLSGSGFREMNFINFFNYDLGYYSGYDNKFFAYSYDGKTIKFQVPSTLTQFTGEKDSTSTSTPAGTYQIRILNPGAISNIVFFTVTPVAAALSLSVTLDPTVVSKNIVVGSTNVEVAKFKLSANSVSDIKITSIIVKREELIEVKGELGACSFQNLKLYDGLNQIGSSIAALDVNCTATFWTSNFIIPKSTSKTLSLKIDVPSSARIGDIFTFQLADISTEVPVGVTGIPTTGYPMTLVSTPSITVVSPNGGERWEIGKTYDIKWRSSNYSSSAEIKIALQDIRYNSFSESPLGEIVIASTQNTGNYTWTIPSKLTDILERVMTLGIGNVYKIVVYSARIGGECKSEKCDTSDAAFSIVATTTSYILGDVNNNGKVDIGDSLFIAQYVAGQRTLTSAQLAAADVNTDGKVTKEDANTIASYLVGKVAKLPAPIAVTVLSPSSGDAYTTGSLVIIKWETSGGIQSDASIGLFYKPDGASGEGNIIQATSNSGSYNWNVPSNVASGHYRIYIKYTYADGKYKVENESKPFGIVAVGTASTSTTPSITVLSPNGGEVWYSGETHSVRWNNNNITKDAVYIYIYDSNISGSGSTNYITPNGQPVSGTQTATGSVGYSTGYYYDWTIPSFNQLPGGENKGGSYNYKIRIVNASNQTISDTSDAAFSIVAAPTSYILGDVNNNGKVDIGDSLYIAQYVTGQRTLTQAQLTAADVNKDGKVSTNDAKIIAQYDVGKYTSLPVSMMVGDIDKSGMVTAGDALLVSQYLAGQKTFDAIQEAAADVNNDNQITQADADTILAYSVGKIKELPTPYVAPAGAGLKDMENQLASIANAISQLMDRIKELMAR